MAEFHVYGRAGCPFCEEAQRLADGECVFYHDLGDVEPSTQGGRSQETVPIVERVRRDYIPGGLEALEEALAEKGKEEEEEKDVLRSPFDKKRRISVEAMEDALDQLHLDGDVEGALGDDEHIEIRLNNVNDGTERVHAVLASKPIASQLNLGQREVLVFGGEEIEDLTVSFTELGIDDGARLHVQHHHRPLPTTVREFFEHLAEDNGKDADWVDRRMETVELDANNPLRMTPIDGILNLSRQGLVTLPEISALHVNGMVNLRHNRLETLPESIDKLKIEDDDLALQGNPIKVLPDSIERFELTGEGVLWLSSNLPTKERDKIAHLIAMG